MTTTKKVQNIYDIYELDMKARDETGLWVVIREGLEILIKAFDNPDTREYLKGLLEQEQRKPEYRGKGKKISDEVLGKINIKAICNTVILDWKGFTNRKGEEIPFSPAAALVLLEDEAMQNLTKEIIFIIGEDSTFNKKALAEETEALKKS